MTEANKIQHGGNHYKKMPIEHWDLSVMFNWDTFQYQITKYVMRWRDKNGLLDLQKVVHFAQKYLEIETLRASGVDVTAKLLELTLQIHNDRIAEGRPTPPTANEAAIDAEIAVHVEARRAQQEADKVLNDRILLLVDKALNDRASDKASVKNTHVENVFAFNEKTKAWKPVSRARQKQTVKKMTRILKSAIAKGKKR